MQLDEKWSFVGKKQAHCNEQEQEGQRVGDCWDHVALDSVHRLVLGAIFGKRFSEKIHQLVQMLKRQLEDRVPLLITTDEYSCYAQAIRRAWSGLEPAAPRTAKSRGRPRLSRRRVLEQLNYATVCKQRENGRVVSVHPQIVFGTEASVAAALKQSPVSSAINTSFIERHNGTDRNRNSRKARRTYGFSKDWDIHEAVGYFTLYSYNFCWCVRTLATRDPAGHRHPRTPAMSAALSDHVWSLQEWLQRPAVDWSG